MYEKSTEELEKVLTSTHPKNVEAFLKENQDSLLTDERPFATYMKQLIKDKHLMQQTIFLKADIPERYGYKLLSEEKRTRQRDVILRICYAAEFSLAETQNALKIYGMPELYARIPRDAMLMICFNSRPGNILDVNEMLKENGMDVLRTSGVQE